MSHYGYFMLFQHICHYLEVYMLIIIYKTLTASRETS